MTRYFENGRFLASQLLTHPLARAHRLASAGRILRWQIASRLMSDAYIVVRWVNGTSLVIERGDWGATGNYYFGLLEFSEMSFVLHMLRPDDLFVDVGANVGVYSVLAGAVGAQAVAFEPIPTTVTRLERMIRVNEVADRIRVCAVGVGSAAGDLLFTADRDTNNRVLVEGDAGGDAISVEIVALDEALSGESVRMLKIDVEGYEPAVIEGAGRLLSSSSLEALIVETAGHGAQFGAAQDEVLTTLGAYGYEPVDYDPWSRRLTRSGRSVRRENTIFVRDVDRVQSRLLAAEAFSLWDLEI